jgi:hypothetical protein
LCCARANDEKQHICHGLVISLSLGYARQIRIVTHFDGKRAAQLPIEWKPFVLPKSQSQAHPLINMQFVTIVLIVIESRRGSSEHHQRGTLFDYTIKTPLITIDFNAFGAFLTENHFGNTKCGENKNNPRFADKREHEVQKATEQQQMKWLASLATMESTGWEGILIARDIFPRQQLLNDCDVPFNVRRRR